MLNPLRPSSDIGELATALRFALLLQETGARSIVARAGILRHLFCAFGVGGVEVGLGRLNGFRFSDWEQEGGPGYTPPYFEFPSLLSALSRQQHYTTDTKTTHHMPNVRRSGEAGHRLQHQRSFVHEERLNLPHSLLPASRSCGGIRFDGWKQLQQQHPHQQPETSWV